MWDEGPTLCLHLFCFSSLTERYIHSSSALPDFNFTINQQNKQTSGRKGGKSEGWGVVGGAVQYYRGVAKDEVLSVAIALQTKRASIKALRRNAEAADWRSGAQDYGWKHTCARLCMPLSRSPRFGFPTPKTLLGWRRNVAVFASCRGCT